VSSSLSSRMITPESFAMCSTRTTATAPSPT
jgi:hypothetical protein